MNRIEQIFQTLRQRQGKALMPFLTAGDPDVATTAALLPALQEAGASICELGIPFSDPVADGPVIQASMTYALEHGVRPAAVLEAVAAQRAKLDLGLVAMVSYSIVYRLGPSSFLSEAAAAGIDGVIVPDLPIEEAQTVRDLVSRHDLTCSFLIAPTTPAQRAADVARACTGFIYLLARAGITGERASLPPDLAPRIQVLREVTDLPIAVGFGVSNGDQVREVVEVADAAIVGSAIVRRIAEHRSEGQAAVVQHVSAFVRELASGLPAV